MNINFGSIRGGSVTSRIGTGQSTTRSTPNTSFGDRLNSVSATNAGWLAELDAIHRQMRSSTNPSELGGLLDYYALLIAKRAMKRGQAAPVPGAAVLSAAINWVSKSHHTRSQAAVGAMRG